MVCTVGTIRLVGGSNSYEGRVEICIDNSWSTVCDDEWGLEEAVVVCNQLGFAMKGNVSENVSCDQAAVNHIF